MIPPFARLAVALLPLLAATLPAQDRPNILWIFCEDLSPYFGCYDDEVNAGHTPTVDQLAAEGVLFRRAYMPAPVCSSCRSAMMAGVYQTTTGTHQHRSSRFAPGVVPEELRIHLPEGIRTIPELMRDAGYFTFNSGKDDYNFHYDRRALYTVGTPEKYVAGQNGWQGNKAAKVGSITEGVWSAREDRDQPWFGQLTLWGGKAGAKHVRDGEKLPPDALQPPPYFPDYPSHREAWTRHYNAARGTDHEVEKVLAQLEADGELENTVVFFFSDHGNNQSLRHKQFCYEGGVHVPLVVWGAHPALEAGTERTDLVSGLDISATTLAMAGVPLPSYLQGVDLFAADHQPRSYVVSARDRCDYTIDRIRTVRTEEWRYIRNGYPDRAMLQPQYRDNQPTVKDLKRLFLGNQLSSYQAEHWFGTRPTEELYHLESDPHQMHNLADDPKFVEQLAYHRGLLDAWIEETGDRGQQPEDTRQLRATYDLWIERPIFRDADTNPEYEPFRKADAARRKDG